MTEYVSETAKAKATPVIYFSHAPSLAKELQRSGIGTPFFFPSFIILAGKFMNVESLLLRLAPLFNLYWFIEL
jgi:hypothetical protein